MLIGVISDSHGKVSAIDAAVRALEGASVYIHAGDYYCDGKLTARLSGVTCYAVSGNCDFGPRGPMELMIELDGKKIYVVHGHLHSVKRGLDLLVKTAAQKGADIVVFGHTHVPVVAWSGNTLLFNPGSVSLGRSDLGNTCGSLEIKGGQVAPRIIRIE
ncbi:MAG TPA: metallophosphoesterase [Firmicutes bacterium]|nr:metallophosphoesterase [Bacillota bacterium]